MTSIPPDRSKDSTAVACPACSSPASGRYCANCGAPLAGATCASCKGDITPGSKFCHHCGATSRPTQAPAAKLSPLPWIVAALALLTMFAMLAGRGFSAARGSTLDAPANALPQAGVDDRADRTDQETATRAPDISAMSPQERTDRLFNKVMLLNSQGKSDSVQFFAP